MGIVVKKPSDDPWTWLGPGFTVHHFQEDVLSTGEIKNHGLANDGNTSFVTFSNGNGFLWFGHQGNDTSHDLKYIYKDLTETSTFVCSFDMTGPARSNNYAGTDNSTFFGIVMKNATTGGIVTWGVDFFSGSGASTNIREYQSETVTKGTALLEYGHPRIDVAETLILKIVRKSSTETDCYLSTDGVSFILAAPYNSATSLGPNPTSDHNRIGVGLDAIENGTAISHYAVRYAIAVDWIAYK